MRNYYVYILTTKWNTTLYAGITNDLRRRIDEHKEGLLPGFTSRYNVQKLVYDQVFPSPQSAIEYEKQLKSWPRKRKLKLIEGFNANWKDLYEEICS